MFIMTYAAFFPILLGTIAGVRAVDRRAGRRRAHDGRAAARRSLTHVVLPAALPSLLVAVRLGVASAWTAVVAAELIGAPSGLGYAIEWYRELLMTPQVMSFIAMIGVLGYLCDRAVRELWRSGSRRGRRKRWRRDDARRAALGRIGLMLPVALLVAVAGVGQCRRQRRACRCRRRSRPPPCR